MSFLARLFRPRVELDPALASRLDTWRALPAASERVAIGAARFVVTDVETSGLDARRDRLLSIGAVAVEAGRLCPAAGYEVRVRNDSPSTRENILVHGITPDEQTGGVPADEALMGFLELARRDVLVGFHAAFDEAVLARAAREHLGARIPNPWLDLALLVPELAPELAPEARLNRRGLDAWLEYFGLRAHARHSAAYDAYSTAELMLILLSRAAAVGIGTVSQLLAAGERRERFRS